MIFKDIKNYRFPFWITVFLFLLVLIPITIYIELFSLAKVFGVLLVLLLFVALKYWFAVARNRNEVVSRVILTRNDLFDLSRDFSAYDSLNSGSKNLLSHRVGLLLAQVKFIDGDLNLLDRRDSIRLSVLYICENWTDDFVVDSDWIFQLTNETGKVHPQAVYTMDVFELNQKKNNLVFSMM